MTDQNAEHLSRIRLGLILTVILFCILIGVLFETKSEKVHPKETGNIRIIDGDTLSIDGVWYDLFGIDAPELGQLCHDGERNVECGLHSALNLHKRVALESLKCVKVNSHSLSCDIGHSLLADGMLKSGQVFASAEASNKMKSEQAYARSTKLGLWRYSFIPPEQWRTGERLAGEFVHTDECPILEYRHNGVVQFSFPTDSDYAKVRADVESIIARHCSDEDLPRP